MIRPSNPSRFARIIAAMSTPEPKRYKLVPAVPPSNAHIDDETYAERAFLRDLNPRKR